MDNKPEYTILPRGKFSLGIAELLQYKELIYIFTWREIKVKYKQTAIGVLWVVLQPLLMMLIINAFLANVFKHNITNAPYYLFVFSGLISWNLFSSAANTSVNAILTNANIIKKIYFPRLIIPVSSVLSSLVDFFISFFVLLIFMLIEDYHLILNINLLYFLISLIVIVFFSLALGLYFSALIVKYRDFRYALPFLIQLLFFLSPVIYNIHLPNPLLQQIILILNPMILGMQWMRKALFGTDIQIDNLQIIESMIMLIIYFFIGLYTFRRTEEYIADRI
ncbi:MAG TPA: ABC transporter permease [Bacteroidia bacterium]|nr:ABC transporter permease [Bacteroidia bacterium]